MLRTHCQTSGWSLAAQDPYNNIVRTTVEAMAAVFGGTQSLHTNAFDEALALPGDFAARIARNTQVILQEETNLCGVVDPWAGSYLMERLTQDMADRGAEIMAQVEDLGGMTRAVESGWAKLQIERCAAEQQARLDAGLEIVVGVNKYRVADGADVEVREIDNTAVLDAQVARLRDVRATRDENAVQAALDALTESARRDDGDLLAQTIAAVRLRATVGECSAALEKVWGRFRASFGGVAGVYGAAREADDEWQAAAPRSRTSPRTKDAVPASSSPSSARTATTAAPGSSRRGWRTPASTWTSGRSSRPRPRSPGRQSRTTSTSSASRRWPARTRRSCPSWSASCAGSARTTSPCSGGCRPAAGRASARKEGVRAVFGPGTTLTACAKTILDGIGVSRG